MLQQILGHKSRRNSITMLRRDWEGAWRSKRASYERQGVIDFQTHQAPENWKNRRSWKLTTCLLVINEPSTKRLFIDVIGGSRILIVHDFSFERWCKEFRAYSIFCDKFLYVIAHFGHPLFAKKWWAPVFYTSFPIVWCAWTIYSLVRYYSPNKSTAIIDQRKHQKKFEKPIHKTFPRSYCSRDATARWVFGTL